MRIRSMTAVDYSVVKSILEDTPEFNAIDLAVAYEVIKDYLEDPESGYITLVAEIDNQIKGYVCYGFNTSTQSTWDIYWMAVSRSSRGQGIGTKLLAAAENNIRAAKGTLMIIETSSTPLYDKTNRLYLYLGWKLDARIKDYYAPGDDLLIYEKRITH